jgi:hypothetical protein
METELKKWPLDSEVAVESTTSLESGSKKGRLVDKYGGSSKYWKYFKVYSNNQALANCKKCGSDISIGNSKSTGHLVSHLRSCDR